MIQDIDLDRIKNINSASQLILLTADGRVLFNTLRNKELRPMIISSVSICKTINHGKVDNLIFSFPHLGDLYIFALKDHYLGCLKYPDRSHTELLAEISPLREQLV